MKSIRNDSGGSGGSYSQNPPFDKRIRTIRNVSTSAEFSDTNLFRGRLESKNKVNGYYRRLQFLYNPSTISWNGNIDVDIVGDSTVKDATDTGVPLLPMSQHVSFQTMFDRTYETWSYNPALEASRLGVLADIKHLYALLGILGNASTTVDTTGADPVAKDSSLALANVVDVSKIDSPSPTSFMQYIPLTMTLGNNLSYYGVIETATVNYTHFTQRMIPNRCSVDFSMMLLPWVPDAAVEIVMPKVVGAYPLIGTGASQSWQTGGNDFQDILAGKSGR